MRKHTAFGDGGSVSSDMFRYGKEWVLEETNEVVPL